MRDHDTATEQETIPVLWTPESLNRLNEKLTTEVDAHRREMSELRLQHEVLLYEATSRLLTVQATLFRRQRLARAVHNLNPKYAYSFDVTETRTWIKETSQALSRILDRLKALEQALPG